ncbi:MAG: response regulator [Candidatus Eremiobacteraeota bacterium]|nr:response regulator [Candidatus Eremiobacteraeota bacterium]
MIGKILVVDDDPHILYLLRITLKTEGFTVITSQDDRGLLELIKKEKPNLLILDLLLPETNGWEICKQLRMISETRQLPIIILSALPFKEQERLLISELNIYEYITKPFEPTSLLAKVKNLFGVPLPLRHLLLKNPGEPGIKRGMTTKKTEVAIIGGGIAALASAEICAKQGSEILLISPWPFLGGETLALNILSLSANFINWENEKIFHLMEKQKNVRFSKSSNSFILNPEGVQLAIYQILNDCHVSFRLNTHLLDVIREGTVITGVVVEGENGAERIETKMVIDATLDNKSSELAGIPIVHAKIDPEANFILGGINGEAFEKHPLSEELKLELLPTLREAVLQNVKLGDNWESFFYEGIEKLTTSLRGKSPGLENTYLLRRPLHVLLEKKNIAASSFPVYGSVIPKTYDRILTIQSSPLDLETFYRQGKIAGILAGIAVELNQNPREIEPEIIRNFLQKEGI